MKKDSGENKKLVGLGSGRDKRKSSSSNQMFKCDLDLYVRTLSRSSPTESRVQGEISRNTKLN